MTDKMIVDLYLSRDEKAINETDKKYGRYCHSIAYNILFSERDSEECVNDTYVSAWNSIPPTQPTSLSAYLGKLVRNISLNRYIRDRAQKRKQDTELIFDEVEEFLPDSIDGASISDGIILRDAINAFLASLSERDRIIFVKRYWFMQSVKQISRSMALTESNIKIILMRTRKSMKDHLEKEGIEI